MDLHDNYDGIVDFIKITRPTFPCANHANSSAEQTRWIASALLVASLSMQARSVGLNPDCAGMITTSDSITAPMKRIF